MRLCTILPVAALLISATTGFACECGDKRPGKEEIVKRFDSDGDGALSEAERAAARAAFEAKKGEMQGKRDEHIAKLKEKHPQLFAKIDSNSDGTLDEAERKAAREQFQAKHGKDRGAACDKNATEHGDNGRRAKGNPHDNGHDHGRRGKDGE